MYHRTTAFTETVPLVLLMLLLLLATSSQSTFERSDPLYGISAEFSPKEPLFASGSIMLLNCTLRNATPGVTAHQAHCTFDGANLTVVVLDDNTFQIRRENVTRQMSHGHVLCHLNVMGTPVQFAQIAIRVADIPVAPNITGCVVNNWVEMVCTWELPKQETGLQTNYTLGWTILDMLNRCAIQQGNTCKWTSSGGDGLIMDINYRMMMIAKNELKTVTSQLFYFHTSRLVKPNPVWNLHPNAIRSQSVDLSWTWGGDNHDDRSRTLLYRVNYTSEWESKSMETTSNNATLSSLVPNTNYTISVECIPYNYNNRRGFWSNKTFISLVTKEDVPGRAPALADGSYSSLANSPGKFEVFWQPVPKRWLHGTLKQYRIRCFNRSHVLAEIFEKHGTRSELNVPDGQYDISVTVEAETTEGYNNSLDLKAIVIPRAGQAPSTPGMVHAVRNQSVFTAMWSSVSNASGYTVYWCKKAWYGVHGRCESSLNWISVSPDVTSLPIPIGSARHDDFLIAVSVDTYVAALGRSVSSGMMLAECLPDIDTHVRPPKLLDFATNQQAFSLAVKWSKPKCEETAYIVKFEILYCQRQSCGEDACCNSKSVFVENDKTKAVITNLAADVEYEVSMRSISFTENSTITAPIRRTVPRSGLSAGVIAAIVIAALVVIPLFVVGLVTIANIGVKEKSVSVRSDHQEKSSHSLLQHATVVEKETAIDE